VQHPLFCALKGNAAQVVANCLALVGMASIKRALAD
jgi:hypothetical protein